MSDTYSILPRTGVPGLGYGGYRISGIHAPLYEDDI